MTQIWPHAFFQVALFVGFSLVGTGCENPDPTAPVALPDERPMPVWGMDFAKAAEATLDPAALDAPASAGQSLFTNHCATCHGSQGAGTAMGIQINGELTLSKTDAILASTVMAGRGAMPSFAGRLSDAQISSIIEWLRTQKGAKPQGAPVPTAAPEGAQTPPTAPEKAPAPKAPTKPVSTRPGY